MIVDQRDASEHGPRLSGPEYDRRIVALHSGLPPRLGRNQQTELRRVELELSIDYRLGVDFPADRRDQLWAVAQRIERRRLRLIFRYLMRRLRPHGTEMGAADMAGYLVQEYSRVLNETELEAFLGDEMVN